MSLITDAEQAKVDKLPVWVRHLIRRLIENANWNAGKLAEAMGVSTTPSTARVRDYDQERHGNFKYLPEHTIIAFALDGDELHVERKEESGRTFVRLSLASGRHIAITGESGNTLNVSGSQYRGVK